jgi:ketosteroid isomerase-like protein
VRRTVSWLAVGCLLSLLSRAQNAADLDAGSKVLALENVWNQAEAKGDAQALEPIFDNSMIYIDEDGDLLTKAQILGKTAKNAGSEQWLVTPEMKVRVYGDTAVVVGSYRVKGVRQGKPYQREGRFIDTWAFKNGAWVCVAAQATPAPR